MPQLRFADGRRGPGVALLLCVFPVTVSAGEAGKPPSPQELIGTAACAADADCRTVAVGHKACGGPAAYLAWSLRRTDPRALAAAAEQSAYEPPPVKGMSSNCALVADPGARCVAVAVATEVGGGADSASLDALPGRCQLRPRGAAGTDLR